MTLDEIEAVLNGIAPGSSESMYKIVRETGLSAVAIFAINDRGSGDELELAGSGTLVSIRGDHYILTARHVWEKRLKPAQRAGITIRTKLNHSFPIEVQSLTPCGPTWKKEPGLGPDIVLLRIPEVYVGSIEAAGRVFYNLSIPDPDMDFGNRLVISMLIGAPKSLGKFSLSYASIQMRGSEVTIQNAFEQNGFDYLDALVNVSNLPGDQSLGGVSGGGLWKVSLYESPDGGTIETVALLQGVAFFEFPVDKGHRVIRCHGTESIKNVAAFI